MSWCSEANVVVLVKLADGLWVYVDTVICFIGDPNSSGPTAQLKLVLNLAKESRGKLLENPLARMDLFYDLIMYQILPNIVSTVWKILLLDMGGFGLAKSVLLNAFKLGNIFGLSQEEFYSFRGFL